LQRDDGGRSRPLGVAVYLFAELRQAFQDIRQKAVEEGWFGRVVTAAPVVEVDREHGIHGAEHAAPGTAEHAAERRASFEERWAPRDPVEHAQDHAPEQDIGMDR
jgi:hypothetical protein